MSPRRHLTLFFIAMAASIFLFSAVLSAAERPAAKEKRKGTVTGKILIKDDGPLTGGQVLFYNAAAGPPPAADKYERTPDIVRDIADDGGFSVELPAGKYYFGAVRRQSGERIGPAKEGDYVYRSLDQKGMPKQYVIKAGGFLDIGTIAEAMPLKAASAKGTGLTAIEGVVFDTAGKPVADAVVVAFVESTLKGKPLFVSDKSDKDGRYRLRVTAGTYFLRVRNMFSSGPPEPGQIVGYYGDGMPAPVTVKEGEEMKGINFKVILFPGRGPFSGTAR